MEKYLFDLTELEFNELNSINGGNDADRKAAGSVIAVVGVTCLAVATGPVGWILLASGTAALLW